MIKSTELAEVLKSCNRVLAVIWDNEFLSRDDIELMRVELTKALARVNAVERVVVGVPVPKSGDE